MRPPDPRNETPDPWRWPRIRLWPALALLGVCLAIGVSNGIAVRLAQLGDGATMPWSRPFLWEITGALGVWFVLPIVRAAVLNAPTPRVGWARFLGLHLAAFALFTSLHIGFMGLSRELLYALFGWGDYEYGPLVFRIPMEMQKDLISYAVAATLWTLFDAWRERQTRALRAAQLEGELRKTQLQALTGQLNPHFLFNALNTVSAVMYEDLPRTDRLLNDLGLLLRAGLETAGPTWSLAEERAHAERFIGVLAARFGDRIAVSWDVPDALGSTGVPRFSLQTLIENAVKHNQDRPERLEVRIRAREDGGSVRVEVEDSGRGFGQPSPAAGVGVGLSQLERVLTLLHGEKASLERSSGAEGGARVTLRVPKESP